MKTPIQYSCPNCGASPLIRSHKDGDIVCIRCDEPLLHDVDSWSGSRYIVCPNPKCRFSGEETTNPSHGDECPRCGAKLL